MPFRRTILIVEDNELNRELLAAILDEEYDILEAENGQVALDILAEHKDRVSLILLDVMMPVMDGFTFLDRMKQNPEMDQIPVIVTTQSNSEADELAALNHGATDFVPKPYRPQVILHRVAALIKLRETASMVTVLQNDRLTGLYTKEFFLEKVRERLRLEPEGEFALVCTNIERFKLVNDLFGVEAGDNLLREVAALTMEQVGDGGFCGRLNGDRFIIFMNAEAERQARARLQETIDHVRQNIEESHDQGSLMRNMVMRWGIYPIHDRTVPIEQMCDRAVLAVDSVRNQYQQPFAIYDDSMRSRLLREQEITAVMEQGIREKQFKVYLQPKCDIRNNRMGGAEALVRWIHPEWGFMSPGEFIPLFEKNGFISKLDSYVWEEVCIKLQEWKQQGLPALPISVNVSRADVFQGNLVETLSGLIKKYDVDPAYLHLEITESAYTENPDLIVDCVNQLQKMGFVIEMDDFGNGYSSLNMLSRMSLDVLKLDMSFVQSEVAKPVSQSFLNHIISMAHQIHLTVVAEGVETREQMKRLKDEGCDLIQGYFYARPMPVAEFENMLREFDPQENESSADETYCDTMWNAILVVDEDADYRKSVKETFTTWYRVVETTTAEEAIHFLKTFGRNNTAAVILSTGLPDDGAAQVLKYLQSTTALWNLPVLATIPLNQCADKNELVYDADDFLCKNHPLFDLYRRVQRMVNVASFRQREFALQAEACRDPLTGLLNRRGLQNAMNSLRPSNMPVAVCLFDLDDLKKVNDEGGHDMGDRMLQSFAEMLQQMTRADDIKCRYGGDEFVAILKHIPNEEAAKAKGELICRSFRESAAKCGMEVACSVGIALSKVDRPIGEEMIEHADKALYEAKRENKGGCCLWEEA
ncbi:MAG: EAL domain-containing protein [Lachnospiraceae bacterium]|nr:EAL domain-containing protein [Lachnospiraceae bacterium]